MTDDTDVVLQSEVVAVSLWDPKRVLIARSALQ